MLGALLWMGCTHHNASQQDEHRTYTDDYNRTVEVPSHPTRIVSTSPAITEIMFAIGADELLVGRTDFCTYPPEASQIASIGGISNLNVESLAALNPDLVISGSMVSAKITHALETLGIPVACVLEQQRFDGLYDNILKIGQLCNREAEAEQLVAELKEQVSLLMDHPAQQPNDKAHRPSMYYVVGFGAGGNYTSGGNTFINDLIEMAGGRNIANGIKGWSYSLESLMEADPDYILIRHEDSAAFCKARPYCNLSAVREGRVIGLASGEMDLQVPRNLAAIRTIRQHIALMEQ